MDSKGTMIALRRIYGEYIEETVRLEKSRNPTAGLLGFGRGQNADSSQERFTGQLEEALGSLAEAQPDSQAVYEVLRYMYELPLENKQSSAAYLMLAAVHKLTDELIGFLSPEDAAVLVKRYGEAYPRSTRLPVQTIVMRRLQAQAGGAGETGASRKAGLLNRLFGRH